VLLAAYVLSTLMGGLRGHHHRADQPARDAALAYWTASGELVFIAILGGAGSVLGAFLGAVVFELVRVYAAASWPMRGS
jgi:branched-chain amino acid transport system permease protein